MFEMNLDNQPLNVCRALEAADKLADALYDLDRAGDEFNKGTADEPTGATLVALMTILMAAIGRDKANVLLAEVLATFERPTYIINRWYRSA